MKSSIAVLFLFSTLLGCNATRPPIDEDSITSGAVQRHGWKPSGPPVAPAHWEDSIDAGSVQRRGWKPSGPPSPPWEDSIDAGSVKHTSDAPTDNLARASASVRARPL
jgi:hypothetical protein